MLHLLQAPAALFQGALRLIRAARHELGAKYPDMEDQWGALRRAYPFRRDLMDGDFRDFDYEVIGVEVPEDWGAHHRMHIHKLMRLAYEEGARYLLEERREHVAAQLAYAIAHYEERYGTLEERQARWAARK